MAAIAPASLQRQVVLAPYTTYKIGGVADYFLEVTTAQELARAVLYAREEGMDYFILGLGANILMSDKGFRGLVIHNRADHIRLEGNLLTAESGALVSDLITETTAKGLSGLEHFAGIPSTVGGAIWQNLHFLAPDRQSTAFIADIVRGATILDASGEVRQVPVGFFDFGYDQSVLHRDASLVVLDVTFELTPLEVAEIERRAKENLEWRAARHPNLIEYPSCGSVFKKIEGVGAGRLIEQAGMKGVRIGGAQVSEQHANFIVNRGGATSADVLALIRQVQEKVKETSGYELETEIRVIGEL